jgi:hypothetical protein
LRAARRDPSTQTRRGRIWSASRAGPIVVDKDVSVGEGQIEPGTILFPGDAQGSVEILWRDPEKKTEPGFLTIRGWASRWKTEHNISLGTSLKELEQLNIRPLHLAGFDWDDSGTITSWENGSLAAELNRGHGRVILRFSCSGADTTKGEPSEVLGDRDFSSHHPVMQKMNPTVGKIVWEFP